MKRFVAALLLLVSPVALAADLAPHRAVYSLALDPQRSGDVTSADGTMALEVLDTCDGWASRQRMQINVQSREGQAISIVTDYTTWESKDGLRLRYRLRNQTEGAVTQEIIGEARLDSAGGRGVATYTAPEEFTRPLPAGTLFPTAHTRALIAAAQRGQRILSAPLFDGTSEDGALNSTTTLLSSAPARAVALFPALSTLPSWRVSIAFFDDGDDSGTPDSTMAMRYWANGVASEMKIDFGEFGLLGTMGELQILPGGC